MILMENEEKPDPDEILKAIQAQEKLKEFGRLKIFFGMSAGVGKTYAMLSEAQQRLKEGVNVVAGVINTHGRKETEAILQGLPQIPEKWVRYKDTVFEEFDLDKILEMKPQLVLVDELAHTNVPGSKHPKRWQDVIEILDAGIDVYTTMNVQHVESRKDLVESLTGIPIRETVPDLILERATSIEIIDIPPQELLQRLKEGKVYLGDQSVIAADNFFQEQNITALREIALRFTAEKVDHDLHGILSQGKGWKTRERLMVAITPFHNSQQLIRAARRVAFQLDAPWVAVYVDTGCVLTDREQSSLNNNFNLVRELGGEVVTTHEVDVATALIRVAQQKDITRVVIGRTPQKRSFFGRLFSDSVLDRLENESKQVDIFILRQDKLTDIYKKSINPRLRISFTSRLSSYAITFVGVIFLTLIGFLLSPFIGYKSVCFLYLLGTLIQSIYFGRGPILFGTILGAFSWDFFFIPPVFYLSISDPDDISIIVFYLITAIVLGFLTSRLRMKDKLLQIREEKIEHLFEIERDISNSKNLHSLRLDVNSRLEGIFPGKFDILTKNADNQLLIESQLSLLSDEKEVNAVKWVFQNGKVAGWSTDSLPSVKGMYFPIKYALSTVGVLIYWPTKEVQLSLDGMNLIQTVIQMIGVHLERFIFEERLTRQDYSRQSERIHHAIFQSLNRSFYEPLQIISDVSSQMQKQNTSGENAYLLKKLVDANARIKFCVDNVIAISELESGYLHFEPKLIDVKELIEQVLTEIQPLSEERIITLDLPQDKILFPFDYHLMKIMIKNILINSIEYTPVETKILLKVEVLQNDFMISVSDEGPGIPKDVLPFIFEKFYQIPGSASKGLGLGLSIVKAAVDIHLGIIDVKNNEPHGTVFTLIFSKSQIEKLIKS